MATEAMFEARRVQGMNDLLARNWWALALRGAAAVILGLLAFLLPGATVATLTILLGAYLLMDGVFAIVGGIRAAQAHERSLPFLLDGVVSLVAGAVALLWPAASLFALVFVIAAWSVITGFAKIMTAWRMHRSHGKWAWGVAGALSVLFGFGMWVLPSLGLLVLALGVGSYLIAYGALAIITAFRLRRCLHDHGHHSNHGNAVAAE
ncbi:COG3247: Uncharacterized conserved protein [Azospirillum argentinense]|uniref:HdeD family acid-resistance protein n=1 Tax=Azospirillum argentinense TaxID=2970906 RepID=UPI0032DEBA94